MNVLFDAPVLLAAMVEGHDDHRRCRRWLARVHAGELTAFVAAHALAEVYATLTRLPVRPRIMPGTARRMVRENIEDVAQIVALSRRNYSLVLDDMAARDLRGAAVYDALAARAAQEADVDRLLTLRVHDFQRAWPDGGDRIQEP